MGIANLLKKFRALQPDPADCCSYALLRARRFFASVWGLALLRLKCWILGISCGRNVRARGTVLLARWPKSRILIGDQVSFVSDRLLATACTLYSPVRLRTHAPSACIEIEQGVQLSGTSITARSQRIHIGAYTMIAPNCIVVDSDFHQHWPPEKRQTSPAFELDRPVSIGKNVWIGMNCLILKGVTIGDGALIAAGSIVTRDIPPNTLAAGVPARVVKYLDT